MESSLGRSGNPWGPGIFVQVKNHEAMKLNRDSDSGCFSGPKKIKDPQLKSHTVPEARAFSHGPIPCDPTPTCPLQWRSSTSARVTLTASHKRGRVIHRTQNKQTKTIPPTQPIPKLPRKKKKKKTIDRDKQQQEYDVRIFIS